MNCIPQILVLATLVALIPACANKQPSPAGTTTTGTNTSTPTTHHPPGTPLSSTYLTFPGGRVIPCVYNDLGNVKAVAVAGTNSGAKGTNPKRNANDLAEEKYLRAMVKKGEFLPGIYKGGAVSYSTGNGLKVFTP